MAEIRSFFDADDDRNVQFAKRHQPSAISQYGFSSPKFQLVSIYSFRSSMLPLTVLNLS